MNKLNKEKYFSHDYGASNDIKIQLMTNDLGMEGYGIYWYVVEQLASNEGYLPLAMIPVIAKKINTEEIKLKGVIEKYDLFIIGDGNFWAERLLNHLAERKYFSEAGKRGANKRWGNKNIQEAESQHKNRGAIRGANATPIALKESKVNKSKVVDAPSEVQSKLKEYAQKYIRFQRESVEAIQMHILQQKNDSLFTDLLWIFCIEKKGEAKIHESYSDFVRHVWYWFNHESFNAEKKLKLKTW